MHKRVIFTVLSLLLLSAFIFFTTAQTGKINYNVNSIDEKYLEEIRLQLNLDCLKDSQCLEGYRCVKRNCVRNEEANSCESISLAPVSTPLFIGQPLNSYRQAFTETNLPTLLADGTIAILENGNITEYNYAQVLFSGNAKLRSENGQAVIKVIESIEGYAYKYRLYFSRDINFSNKETRGQTLKILGKEYVIGSDSTNSDLYLISNERQIKLEDSRRVMVGQREVIGTTALMIKGETGNVAIIEILFNKGGVERSSISSGSSYSDPAFNSSELSFHSYSDRAFLTLGGKC